MKGRSTTRFLITSLIGIALLCVFVFSFLAVHMNNRSAATINQVGSLYMSSMSEQISMHFETTIGLLLDQLDALVKTVVPDRIHEDQKLLDDLAVAGQVRDFSHLAFYRLDNTMDMVYGDPLEVVDPEPFLSALTAGEKRVAIALDQDGDKVVLLGVPAAHDPTEEHPCAALVAAFPTSYISETLSLDENSEHVYSFIIRRNGDFVIRSGDAFRNNYFERVRTLYEDVNGLTAEEYLSVLQSAMDQGVEYSNEFTIYGERRHLYSTQLAYCDWHLLTFMPYGTMDSIVNGLNREWVTMALIGGGIIILALILVYIKYYGISQQQLREREEAQAAAEAAQREAERAQEDAEHA
ncbi:MAG: cache domain-containing protein, partial [Roseburia sp.]|nr:cache domain-containing protein [Roseburia sp.]